LAVSVIEPASAASKTSLVILCVIVIGITLSAGLWPFSFHTKNEVWWKAEQGGLIFGDTGMVISNGIFSGIPTDTGLSIELWLEPELAWDSSTILSFYEPEIAPRMQVRQSGDDLVVASSRGPEENRKKQRSVFVDHVFRKGEKTLVTLTSSGDVLDMYVDGVLKKSVRSMKIEGADFAGTLIVANAPYGNLSWKGTFRGLAFYDRALRPDEINEDYDLWQRHRELIARKTAPPYSLYLFNELSGERLHNAGKAGPDLVIPKYYFIFRPGFLVPFWKEYRPNWDYAKNLAINVFGLVPLGFCFSALFARFSGHKRSLLCATLLGFSVSLTIEILQAFMPTRYSGTTDLITNTSGAALGAWLYLNAYSQIWLKRSGLVRAK
jgi:VanZ like family/Concanavalin A-like lectin/glucanases superfamily